MFCHQEGDSTGDSLRRAAEERGCEIVDWHAHAGETAPSLDGVAALVPLGGLTNPDEAPPWLEAERAVLREAVERGTAVLAICLGSQLLAQALGAPAYRLTQPEIGFYDAHPTGHGRDDPVLSADGPFPVFAWHDYGFDLPAGARHLAHTGTWGNQAFRHGERVWGLQYHVEVDRPRMLDWLEVGSELARARGFDPAVLRARVIAESSGYETAARALMHRFLDVAG